jgi:endo-1,4-beta-xylanase
MVRRIRRVIIVAGVLSTVPFLPAVILGGDAAVPAPAQRREPPRGAWLDPVLEAPGGTKYATFVSNILWGTECSYLVYLPPDYEKESSKRYPVIYWLHGYGGNQRVGAQVFIPRLAAAIKQGSLPPAICVSVNGVGASFYRDNPNGSLPVESVIVKDLIPHVDRTYRTIALREGRVIQGFSMGGYGAGHLGFKYPELFGTVLIDAGAMADEFFPDEHPNKLARQNSDKLRGRTRIRIGIGSEDDLLPSDLALHKLLDELKIEHEYRVVPGVGHNSPQYYDALGSEMFAPHRAAFERLAEAK